MKYQITYRLTHPAYLPTTSMAVIEAHSHTELETQLVKILSKWRAQGYTVRIIRTRQEPSPHHHR